MSDVDEDVVYDGSEVRGSVVKPGVPPMDTEDSKDPRRQLRRR